MLPGRVPLSDRSVSDTAARIISLVHRCACHSHDGAWAQAGCVSPLVPPALHAGQAGGTPRHSVEGRTEEPVLVPGCQTTGASV